MSGTHPAIVIREAATKQDFAVFAALIGEYVEWCVSQCGNDEVLVREVFGSQMVGREMADPKAYYGRPHGCVFLAEAGGAFAGYGDLLDQFAVRWSGKVLIEKPANSVPKAMAQFALADLYVANHENDKAKTVYSQIAGDNPKGDVAQIAKAHLEDLK